MSSSVFIPPAPDAFASEKAMSFAYTLTSLLAEPPYSDWKTEVAIQCSGTDYETICIRWIQKFDLHAGFSLHGVTLEREKTLRLNSRVLVKTFSRMVSESRLTDVLEFIFASLEKEKMDYVEGRRT